MLKIIFTKELKENLVLSSLFFLAFFQFLPINIESYGVFILIFIGCIVSKKINISDINIILCFSLFFLYEILTLTYTDNYDRGFKVLLRRIAFLLMPIAFILIKDIITKKTIRVFLMGYIISLFMLGVCLIFFIVNFFEIDSLNLLSLAIKNGKFKHTLLNNFYRDLHPTYASINFLLGILILLQGMLVHKKTRVINLFLVFFFTLIILLLNSRIAIISYVFVVPIFLLLSFNFLNFKKLLYLLTFSVVISCLTINFIGEKKTDTLKLYAKNSLKINEEGVSRIQIYETSLGIIKQKYLFGVGVGDVKSELIKNYKARGLDDYYKNKNYNSHNQYLHFLMEGGLPLLILFLLTLGYLFYHSIKKKDYLFFSFLLIIFLVLFTENIFNRINGIFFFSLFSSFLYHRKKTAF